MHRFDSAFAPWRQALLLAAVLAALSLATPLVLNRASGTASAATFAITAMTAGCDGTGTVSFTGTIPAGGFTLELKDKAPDNSGSFIPTVPPTIITITSGSSPVPYTMPLANWSPPHLRIDSNFSTKSPSLFCQAVPTSTPTPSATATANATSEVTSTRRPRPVRRARAPRRLRPPQQ